MHFFLIAVPCSLLFLSLQIQPQELVEMTKSKVSLFSSGKTFPLCILSGSGKCFSSCGSFPAQMDFTFLYALVSLLVCVQFGVAANPSRPLIYESRKELIFYVQLISFLTWGS